MAHFEIGHLQDAIRNGAEAIRRLRAILAMWPPFPLLNFARAQVVRGKPSPGVSGHFIRIEGGLVVNEDEIRTARETTPTARALLIGPMLLDSRRTCSHSPGSSSSPIPASFERGSSLARLVGGYPDADLNLSYRLQQLTSIKTDPDARVVKLTDRRCSTTVDLYGARGYLRFSEDEVAALRKYLLNGGTLFVNDFWGHRSGMACRRDQPRAARPRMDRLDDRPSRLQLRLRPSRSDEPAAGSNISFEPGPRSQRSTVRTADHFPRRRLREMHVHALLDDRRRMMILAIHNSDVSDCWEREARNELYFRRYSERIAYPLGINIIFYLMTH